jgi:hypothetical protein
MSQLYHKWKPLIDAEMYEVAEHGTDEWNFE